MKRPSGFRLIASGLARRMTRVGDMSLGVRWREPDIVGFPRRERRERMLLCVLIGLFAGLSWFGALSPISPMIGRVGFGVPAVTLTLAIVKVLSWRPRFVASQS